MENIDKIIWSDEFSLGNPSVDKDHKRLVEICNHLIDFIKQGGRSNEFAEILSEMTDYTLSHFEKEEKYMEKMSYPKFEQHREQHKNYIYKVAKLNYELMSNDHLKPEEIISFLKKWWENHILIQDKEYELYKIESGLKVEYK
jgi:hemerythrin